MSLILLPCIVTAEPHIDTYSVQIAAYKQLPEKLVKSVEQYGSIHISHHGELTRVSVGNFAHKSAAEKLLLQLRQAGYKDAFISHINTHSSSIENQSNPHGNETHSSPMSEMTKFRSLPKSDKDRAVFINGRLHLKEGKRFILVP